MKFQIWCDLDTGFVEYWSTLNKRGTRADPIIVSDIDQDNSAFSTMAVLTTLARTTDFLLLGFDQTGEQFFELQRWRSFRVLQPDFTCPASITAGHLYMKGNCSQRRHRPNSPFQTDGFRTGPTLVRITHCWPSSNFPFKKNPRCSPRSYKDGPRCRLIRQLL